MQMCALIHAEPPTRGCTRDSTPWRTTVSLMLLDLNLPAASGWSVIRALAQNPLTSDIPVIVVTGVEPTPELPHARKVLGKPCDPDYVAYIVADHLGVERADPIPPEPLHPRRAAH